MAKNIVFNHTDTAISGITSCTVDKPLVNFGADFVKVVNTPNELVLTNMRSPIGDPEIFRHAYSLVSNIYKGSDIEPSMRSQNVKGVRLLSSHTDIITVTDTEDASFILKAPVKTWIVQEIPAFEYMTGTIAEAFARRTFAALYDSGLNTAARMNALLRGSLTPADLK